MKAGIGFHNVVRIHVADQVLERSEGETGLIGLARVFHYVVSMRAGQVVVTAPDSVSGDVYVVAAAARRVKIEGLTGGVFHAAQYFPVDVTGNFFHVAHNGPGVLEDVVVDALQNVGVFRSVAFAVGGLVGGVDVAAGYFLAGDEFPFNGEKVSNSGNAAQ